MAAARHVEVAVDAAGAGGERAYTYLVPEALADVAAGEAVVVGFGRRQALGIVLGDVPPPAGIAVKPILERVRTDGPLLPPLTLALARWIAAHYLAPPAVVVRAMLPPGLLERLELRVFAVEGRTSEGLPQDAVALLREAGAAGIAARRLATSVSQRPALLRALHVEAQAGRLGLAWVLRGPEVRPRVERRARITPAGRAALGRTPSSPAGHAADAPRLGVRQR
ncbi:MAG: primosomal protein N' family DNA-binding protein, partial [Candidatus Limnocylindrales bacterium]